MRNRETMDVPFVGSNRRIMDWNGGAVIMMMTSMSMLDAMKREAKKLCGDRGAWRWIKDRDGTIDELDPKDMTCICTAESVRLSAFQISPVIR